MVPEQRENHDLLEVWVDLLAGIEEVEWEKWEHAYGPATDVPGLLRELLSEETQEDAQYELYGNIIHQGTVYPATKHVIPWLLKLLAPESTADRVWLLQYLLDLAWGDSYMRQHAHLDDDGSEEYGARMAEEVSHVDQVRAAVVEGFPVYAELFTSEDVSVVGAAIDLIVGVPELMERLQAEAWSSMAKLFVHSDSRLRTKAVMGLAWHPDWERVSNDVERARTDKSEAVRWAAAWTSGYHRQYSAQVVEELVGVMLEPNGIDEELEGVLERSAGQASIAPLLSAPEEFHTSILEGMASQLNRAKSIDAMEAARLMLLMVFGQTPAPSREELGERQLEVLRLVVACDEAWVFDGNMSQLLSSWKLPSRRDKLRYYVD